MRGREREGDQENFKGGERRRERKLTGKIKREEIERQRERERK